MTDFKVTVEGIDSLEEEFNNEFIPRVDKAVTAGLNAVASDLTASLKQHIEKDVYEAYDPKVYHRRYASGGMLDQSNFETRTSGNVLTFNYAFNTDTPVYADEDGVVVHEWKSYISSDDVIRAIQDGRNYPTIGALTENGVFVSRPFWDNFAKEQLVDGKAEASLVKGINDADSDLQAVPFGKTILDGEDSDDLHGKPEHGRKG